MNPWITLAVSAAAMIVGWIISAAIFAAKVGKFQGETSTEIGNLKAGQVQTREEIQRSEARVQSEIKELRTEQSRRFDDIYQLLVRKGER